MKTDKDIKNMVINGQIIAYADDLIITTYPGNFKCISKLIEYLDKYGLNTNQNKYQYIWHTNVKDIDKLGKYSKTIKYLGVWIRYDKMEVIKNNEVKIMWIN